jgi:hypothetical protein
VASVKLADCAETGDDAIYQLWFQAHGKLRNAKTDMCIDVDSNDIDKNGIKMGAKIVQRNCEETVSGQWEIEANTDRLVNTFSKNKWGASKPMCVDVSKTESIESPTGSLASATDWAQSPVSSDFETVVNGDMVDGTAIAHESGSYSTGGCTPGVATCGIRSITAVSNTADCSATSKAVNKCPCPVDVADRNGDKCGVLKFDSTGGAQSEYEIHNKPGNMGYAGVVRVGAWVKCKGGWDGDRVIIHSRFYGGDSKNEVLGAPSGPWKSMNADCKATGGDENVWEWVSLDFDSKGKVIDHYSVYIGYPQKSTKGEVSVAGVSVKPLTWVPRGETLEMSSSIGYLSGFSGSGNKNKLDTSSSAQ